MMKIKNMINLIFNRRYRFLFLSGLGVYNKYSDEKYIRLAYKCRIGKELDLKNPHTFNEKLQWIKLFDHNDLYTMMADKYEAKKIVAEKIGNRYVIPTIGIWDRFDDIDFSVMPNQFVLKCTHDSGGLVICKDKATFNIEEAKRKIESSLSKNYYLHSREWPYKNIKPRIIAEQYMEDGDHSVLPVYKFFNFNNGPIILQAIHGDKTENECIDYFNQDWQRLDIHQNFRISDVVPEMPKSFEEMKSLAKRLSEGFPFLRTDFYEVNGRVFFSEFTFFSDGGFEPFHPEYWDRELGNRIDLSVKNALLNKK